MPPVSSAFWSVLLKFIPKRASVWEPLGKAYAAIVGGADPTKTMQDAGKTINEAIAASSGG